MFNLFVINDFYPFKQQHNEINSSILLEEKDKEIIAQSLVILKGGTPLPYGSRLIQVTKD